MQMVKAEKDNDRNFCSDDIWGSWLWRLTWNIWDRWQFAHLSCVQTIVISFRVKTFFDHILCPVVWLCHVYVTQLMMTQWTRLQRFFLPPPLPSSWRLKNMLCLLWGDWGFTLCSVFVLPLSQIIFMFFFPLSNCVFYLKLSFCFSYLFYRFFPQLFWQIVNGFFMVGILTMQMYPVDNSVCLREGNEKDMTDNSHYGRVAPRWTNIFMSSLIVCFCPGWVRQRCRIPSSWF